MSVVIRGMKMPKSCDECPCYYETDGAWRNECEVLGKEYIADDYRPEWCPLIELPPHGRLIDADALLDKITRTKDGMKYVDKVLTASKEELRTALINIPLCVNNAPTVIEEEVSE